MNLSILEQETLACVAVSYRRARLAESLKTRRPRLPLNANVPLGVQQETVICVNKLNYTL